MADEITFMDLASMLKITPNTQLEKLGSALNASIFDASNIAGSLKQKGLIEFTANYPGPNTITITDSGKAAMQEADSKSSAPIDVLDESILAQLSGGKRLPAELQNTLNIRPKDLAFRLYKLSKHGLLVYELKNGGVELLLTEQGFLMSKVSAKQAVTAEGMQGHNQETGAAGGMSDQSMQNTDTGAADDPIQQTSEIRSAGKNRKTAFAVLGIVLVVIVLAVVLMRFIPI